MNIPENLKYTKEHEWIRVEDGKALIGITHYAQESLGDIVFVECPQSGQQVSRGDEVVNIEAAKVAKAINTPVSGTIAEVNTDLEKEPEALNKAAFETCIFSVTMSHPAELEDLMDAAAYKDYIT